MKEKTIPKTTSGKIQRRKTRTLLHSGGLNVVHELSDASGAMTAAATPTPSIVLNDLPVLDAPEPAPETTATVAHAETEAVAASEKPAASPCPEPLSHTSADDSSSCGDNHIVVRILHVESGSSMD